MNAGEIYAIVVMSIAVVAAVCFLDFILKNLPAAGLRYRVDETGAVIFPPFEDDGIKAAARESQRGEGCDGQRPVTQTHTRTSSVSHPERPVK